MVLLYVDDDAEDIEIFTQAVKEIDSTITCMVAQHGKQAIDILHAGLVPDYIFLDINMPVINGRDILREIRKIATLNSMPIVMYSTTVSAGDANEYRAMGANYFMVKPNHYQELCDAISAILHSPES
jgi:CheY-like chemotaxis protein